MPNWKYSVKDLDPDRTAKASGRELSIKPKAAREICNHLKGMKLQRAKQVLKDVIDLKKPIPYKRHNKKLPHKKGLNGFDAGRFPKKASKEILQILESVEANAEFKGLYADRLKIIHMASQKGRIVKDYIQRAFGRASPHFNHLTHIEVAVEEV